MAAADGASLYTEAGLRPPPEAVEEAARIHRAIEAEWRRILADRAARLPRAGRSEDSRRQEAALAEARRAGQRYARIFPYDASALDEAAGARAEAIALLPQRRTPMDLSALPPPPVPDRHVVELYVRHPSETTRRIVKAAKRWSAVDVHVIAVVDPRRPGAMTDLPVRQGDGRSPSSQSAADDGAFLVRYIDFLGRRAARHGIRRLPAAVYHHQGRWRVLDEQAVLAWLEGANAPMRNGGTKR